MKIDGNRYTQEADAAKGAEASRRVDDHGAVKSGGRTAAGGTDSVHVSADAKLVSAALKAADADQMRTERVRTEVVDAMKAKLAAGKVGDDSGRLADHIIDDLLKD